MNDDTISRRSVIKEIDELLHTAKGESEHDLKMLRRVIKDMLPSAQQWIPCSERLPEEDHWLGGSGRQFSEKVMVTIVNHSDEDTWVDMTQTIDGEWACELPKYCEIVAWMPLPEPWKGEQNE